ncbi:MAG: adenylate/guanylate cyclase domain-containing protein [Stackebrandtia sp.]
MDDIGDSGPALPSGLVTFLFTDIEGSTRMACQLGDGYRRMLHDHRRLLRDVFGKYTGTELLTEGDSFFVVFSDADAALNAAVEAQHALAAHRWPTDPGWSSPARPKVRMGLHSGHAVPDEQGYATSLVHRAARVCAAAHGDQILCTEATLDAVREPRKEVDLGLHLLRGFDDPEHLHQINSEGLPDGFPPPAAQPRPHNLPACEDEFVGRDREIGELARLLETHRLLSVTALPRTGKTRLVRTFARRIAPAYRDGVWYAALDADTDPAAPIAETLGLRPDPFRPIMDTLIETLRSRNCLLVFDGARTHHASAVTRLLSDCPDVSVLSASRQPLGLPGEVKWALPTMSVADSATLLRRRAAACGGGADLGDCTALAAAVDGFPPAMEILARVVPVLGEAELLRRLHAEPFGVLDARGELSDVLDEACRQLTPHAVRLLYGMSALSTPAGVDEAERLCGASAAALDALISLVDSSLVDVQRTGSGAVYRLPAPVRWYADARRRQAGAPVLESAPPRHARFARLPLPRLSWARAMS